MMIKPDNNYFEVLHSLVSQTLDTKAINSL